MLLFGPYTISQKQNKVTYEPLHLKEGKSLKGSSCAEQIIWMLMKRNYLLVNLLLIGINE